MKAIRFLPAMLLLATASLSARAERPEILFEGVDPAWLPTLYAYLSLDDLDCKTPSWKVRDLFERADREIAKALRAFGHYRPRLRKRLKWEAGCWQALFRIDPGPPVRIARLELTITGDARRDPAFQEFRHQLPLRIGDPLHHGRYEQLKQGLLDLASSRGYFRARLLKHQLRVDPETLRAEIDLHLDSGERFRISQILWLGAERFSPHFLRRFLPFREGSFYSREKLDQLWRSLVRSGYFQSVELVPIVEEDGKPEVLLKIRLVPRRRHFLQVGAGFESGVGPRARLHYQNRSLGRYGRRAELEGRLSPIDREIALQYLIPHFPPSRPGDGWLSFSGGALWEETETFQTRNAHFGGRLLQRGDRFEESLGLRFQYERSQISSGKRRLLLLMPEAGWLWRFKDHPLSPRRGLLLQLDLASGIGLAQGAPTFLRGKLFTKAIGTLPGSGRILGRIEVGALWARHFGQLPASQRFFTGGAGSIRGFRYKQLGGDGGRYLLVGSLEYEQPITQSLGIALFLDGGNAYAHLNDPTMIGAGVGIRWRSPIGPLRLDLAAPLRGASPTLRLYISLGPDL